MLREFIENHHCKFANSASDWKEAIRMSCETLEADGTIEGNYKEDIIKCVEKYGPYIVIMPDVAMPHSQECAKGVNRTAIGFMKLKEAVSFEPGNEEMNARIFFTLASCNPEQHLENMTRLSELLMNEELIEKLKDINSESELLELQEKYLD